MNDLFFENPNEAILGDIVRLPQGEKLNKQNLDLIPSLHPFSYEVIVYRDQKFLFLMATIQHTIPTYPAFSFGSYNLVPCYTGSLHLPGTAWVFIPFDFLMSHSQKSKGKLTSWLHGLLPTRGS